MIVGNSFLNVTRNSIILKCVVILFTLFIFYFLTTNRSVWRKWPGVKKFVSTTVSSKAAVSGNSARMLKALPLKILYENVEYGSCWTVVSSVLPYCVYWWNFADHLNMSPQHRMLRVLPPWDNSNTIYRRLKKTHN